MDTESEKLLKAQQSARVEKVLAWRKYIATLEEEEFFDIIRIYLGEVRTPYNKQDLVEELSAFLRKDENKNGIVRLLSGIDLKILAAVRFIPAADTRKITEFFSSSMSSKHVEAHISNLMQRLLIFSMGSDEKGKQHLCMNPLLEERLLDLLDIDVLLPSYRKQPGQIEMPEVLGEGKTAAMISYVLAHPDLCKANGDFKKKDAEELAQKMGDVEQAQTLMNSLRNLGLFTENASGKKLLADWDKAESLARLDPPHQKAYLCVANLGHLTRSSLYESAQLLYDTLDCARESHYGREALLRLSFLIKQKDMDRNLSRMSSGRFQSLISRSPYADADQPVENLEGSMGKALDAAIAFGYVVKEGEDEEGKDIYCVNPLFFEGKRAPGTDKKGTVSIDAAFTFMIMPGLTLKEFLPLIKFLELVKYDTVLSFQINKASAMRSFDMGMDAQKIRTVIGEYTDYPIPQNLDVSLDEWFGSYSSASLYKGYVLKVSGENETKVKRNPFLSSHIIEVLAPGLYLLDFADDIMAQAAIKHCGMDFIGKVKTKEKNRSGYDFYSLQKKGEKLSYAASGKSRADDRQLKKEQDALLESLKNKVCSMKIPQEQKDGLLARIDRRLIVNEDQLRPESIRFEKLEALAMDYQGKLHVIENSILAKCLVELTSGEEEDGEAFLGEVTALSKYEGEAEVTLKREDGKEKTFSVSKASLVRKVVRPLTF
ncbi:MAG: helicase-associated domain-containing protein [Treponema sp.]|nr:helicase-associated domain-containing protein [Treponema sp.]